MEGAPIPRHVAQAQAFEEDENRARQLMIDAMAAANGRSGNPENYPYGPDSNSEELSRDDMRRERRKASNRSAARRCREKKLLAQLKLMKEKEDYEKTIQDQRNIIQRLTHEKAWLNKEYISLYKENEKNKKVIKRFRMSSSPDSSSSPMISPAHSIDNNKQHQSSSASLSSSTLPTSSFPSTSFVDLTHDVKLEPSERDPLPMLANVKSREVDISDMYCAESSGIGSSMSSSQESNVSSMSSMSSMLTSSGSYGSENGALDLSKTCGVLDLSQHKQE